MDFITLLLLSVGLAMDAFAVSVCKGLSMKKAGLAQAAVVGLWFGVFQALMPVIGYYVGIQFMGFISAWDHWLAFGLLVLIGANMIRESFQNKEETEANTHHKSDLNPKDMFIAAVATSIDALAVGVSFAAMDDVNIWYSVAVIGVVTLILSMIGVKAGGFVGKKMASKAELLGGIILICIGIKIVVEHMFFS